MPVADVVVVTGPLEGPGRDRVTAAAGALEVVFADRLADADAVLPRARVVAGDVGGAALDRAGALAWVHSWQAGTDGVALAELAARRVVLTSSAGNGAVPLAEHALMLLLMADRDAGRWLDAQRAHRWERYRHPELAGSTVGVVGLGNSGVDLVGKLRAFHVRVLGLRRRADRAVEGVERVYGHGELHAFLAECDHVVVTAPLTAQTSGMLDDAAFAAVRPGATLVNVSRGGVVDDAALLRALRSGRVRAAGLDAHAVEPLPADSPFWDEPHVVVTPHNGATTPGTLTRQLDIFVENLGRFVRGEPLRNVVDPRLGY